jgi:hypothetical protein
MPRAASAGALLVELPPYAASLASQLETMPPSPADGEPGNASPEPVALGEHDGAAMVPDASGRTASEGRFYPNRLLDRRAVPISAPNPREFLTGTSIPAVPFRLRLYVDEAGKVVRVEVREPFVIEESRLQVVKDMFLATPFIPGHLKGRDVPAYLDIEIELADIVQPSSPAAPAKPVAGEPPH